MQKYRDGEFQIIGSDAVEFELSRIKDPVKQARVMELYEVVEDNIALSAEIEARSRQIREQSEIRMLDSLQIAFAEAAQADVMLTTDDRLEKMAARVPLNIRVLNPLRFDLETLFGR